MATLVRWDPFREVAALQNEMSRCSELFREGERRERAELGPGARRLGDRRRDRLRVRPARHPRGQDLRRARGRRADRAAPSASARRSVERRALLPLRAPLRDLHAHDRPAAGRQRGRDITADVRERRARDARQRSPRRPSRGGSRSAAAPRRRDDRGHAPTEGASEAPRLSLEGGRVAALASLLRALRAARRGRLPASSVAQPARPVNIRLLIVPSGRLSCSASSDWVRPP